MAPKYQNFGFLGDIFQSLCNFASKIQLFVDYCPKLNLVCKLEWKLKFRFNMWKLSFTRTFMRVAPARTLKYIRVGGPLSEIYQGGSPRLSSVECYFCKKICKDKIWRDLSARAPAAHRITLLTYVSTTNPIDTQQTKYSRESRSDDRPVAPHPRG